MVELITYHVISRINDAFGDEGTRHVFSLLDSALVVIGVKEDYNDFKYSWNLANSSIEIVTT